MQTHAQHQWRSRCCAKALLTSRQTPAEFERHAYRPSCIVFVSHWDPEHSHEALAHYGMELPSILAHYFLGQGVEDEQQAVQGIEINTRSMGRGCSHRTAEHCDGLVLGLASRRRSRAGRR
jgi:hypothetical protein